MAGDPEGLVTFEAGDVRYTAVFGFKAMKAVEAHYDLPFFQAMQEAMPSLTPEDANDPVKVAQAGASIRMTSVSKLFHSALLKHHPDMTEDKVDDVIDELGIEKAGDILGRAVSAAISSEGDGKSPSHPRTKARQTA